MLFCLSKGSVVLREGVVLPDGLSRGVVLPGGVVLLDQEVSFDDVLHEQRCRFARSVVLPGKLFCLTRRRYFA